MSIESVSQPNGAAHLELEWDLREVDVHELDGAEEAVANVGEGSDMIFDFDFDFVCATGF